MGYTLRTVDIKGKQYVPVNERIKCFRNAEEYKGWSMVTDIITATEDRALIKARILDPQGNVRAEGLAYEEKTASNINRTSHVENCETSAWGRALGNLGIGIDCHVRSADEMQDAMERQEILKSKIDKVHIAALKDKVLDRGLDVDMVLTRYDLSKVEDMTIGIWEKAMRSLDKTEKKGTA